MKILEILCQFYDDSHKKDSTEYESASDEFLRLYNELLNSLEGSNKKKLTTLSDRCSNLELVAREQSFREGFPVLSK